MTNTTAPQPPAHAFPDQSFRTALRPRTLDGALFIPASRYSAASGPSPCPARAAAHATARAMRAQGQTAWAGTTQGGTWGVFLAL